MNVGAANKREDNRNEKTIKRLPERKDFLSTMELKEERSEITRQILSLGREEGFALCPPRLDLNVQIVFLTMTAVNKTGSARFGTGDIRPLFEHRHPIRM